MDGQKGLIATAKTLWPNVPIQRCQFHLVAFAMQHIGRRPTEKVGIDLMNILYSLKDAKTHDGRDTWIRLYKQWEIKYDHFLSAKDKSGHFLRPRLRSARLIIRRALPNLFVFLDHPGSPNTTNLVEGWINGAIAEMLRLHRGLRVHEKKALATSVLSNLKRKTPKKAISPEVRKQRQKERSQFFIKKYMRQKARAMSSNWLK
jgi:hypothetical protein